MNLVIWFPAQLYCSFPTKLTQTVEDPGGSPQKKIALTAMAREKALRLALKFSLTTTNLPSPAKEGWKQGCLRIWLLTRVPHHRAPLISKSNHSSTSMQAILREGKKKKKKKKKRRRNKEIKSEGKKEKKDDFHAAAPPKRSKIEVERSPRLYGIRLKTTFVRPITDCLPPVRRRSLRKARILVCRHFQLLDPFPFLSFNFSAMPFSPPLLSLSLSYYFHSLLHLLFSPFLFFFGLVPVRQSKSIKKNSGKTRQSTDMPHPKL